MYRHGEQQTEDADCEAVNLIVRVVCLVHMRRPLYKLRQGSNDAGRIVWIVDMLFYEGREIKRHYWEGVLLACNRCLSTSTIINSIYNNICATFSVG